MTSRSRRSGVVGKAGIVRLHGEDMEALWQASWSRSGGMCERCGMLLNRYSKNPMTRAELSHVRTKRNNGDGLDNVQMLCGECHHSLHNPKVVPRKGGG
jgi:hypothetical protein